MIDVQEEQINYFKREKEFGNPKFLSRFPNINFINQKILDLGCGHGALSIDIAIRGANKVVGIDLNRSWIDFANDNLKNNYPNLIRTVSFTSVELRYLEENNFDIIISKASFEHIINLDNFILEIRDKLRIGGRLIIGFGPLYNSPYGEHQIIKHKIPWMHLIVGEKYIINKLNCTRKEKVTSISELGLNGLSFKQYEKIFFNTRGLKVVDFRTNVSKKILSKVFNVLRVLPGFREFFTQNVYCILERTE